MRSDLSAAFIAAKNRSSRKPRLLMVFQFPVTGTVYVSDQRIALGGVTYLPLVESWGTLTDAGAADNATSAEVRQMSVTLWNGGDPSFSTRFLKEDPENVEVLLYQWFVGLEDWEKALIDRFVIQDPISFSESSRLLQLDFVSVNMRYAGRCGTTVNTTDYPYALAEDVGKDIPLIFGNAGECASLCVKTAPQASLKGSIVATSLSILCNESLDDLGFPASGTLQIEDEKIRYTSRSDSTFYASVRGYTQTRAVSHPDNAELHQVISDHTYLFGSSPITSITTVKVNGHYVDPSMYAVSFWGKGGKVVFNQKPHYTDFSASAETQEEWFDIVDNVGVSFPAWQGYNAIDDDHTSTSAMINEVYRTLSLKNINSVPDMGMVMTAYLVVHHWETNVYTSDYCEVYVEGIGVIGRLSRPSSEDILRLEANVDVVDEVGYKDPRISTTDPVHKHYTGATKGLTVNGSPSTFGPYGALNDSGWRTISFYGLTHAATSVVFTINLVTTIIGTAGVQFIEFRSSEGGGYILLDDFGPEGPNGTYTFAGVPWNFAEGSVVRYDLQYRIACYHNTGSSVSVRGSLPMMQYDGAVGEVVSKESGVSAYVSAVGMVTTALTDIKDIEFISKKTPTRTLVDRFDLSDFITPSWSWFANRKVQVRYVGSADDVNVFIPWITFEIEFRRRETLYSDKVTATVVGSTSNRPDQVLTALLGKGNLPDEYIDTAGFAAVGAEFSDLGYTIDGVIDGGMSVQDAIKKVCRQTRSRLYWSAGKAKLALRKAPSELAIAKYLGPDNYQLKSITAVRQPVQDIVNSIELFHTIDRVRDDSPFTGSEVRTDAASIKDHGVRDKRDEFKFDLVRNVAMATDLAEYYIGTLANPSTFYEFNGYLEQAELEKEDVVALTSAGFNKMRKVPLVLRQINHIFGSGKNRAINLLHLVAECYRYILVERQLTDTVVVMDDIIAVLGEWLGLSDSVHVVDDELYWEIGASFADSAIITDVLTMMWTIIEEQTETVMINDDDLRASVGVQLTDTVKISDLLVAWEEVGFGAGGFGQIGFGGLRAFEASNPDEVLIVDELALAVGAALGDSMEMTDWLMASNGFGSVGLLRTEGFGKVPMGH